VKLRTGRKSTKKSIRLKWNLSFTLTYRKQTGQPNCSGKKKRLIMRAEPSGAGSISLQRTLQKGRYKRSPLLLRDDLFG
ncbi:hypothetical protein L0156_07230, partial [bacterium]|nr:hypothetical protein [bacterium]